jgi:hypothetical protein
MPNGSYWVGRGGFNYKRSGGAGGRRNFSLGAITNQPADINNTFIPGSGVGASSIATRRAKILHSTINSKTYPYNQMYARLGLQMSGGSNDYAYNWYINDVWPNPYPIYRQPTVKTLSYSVLPNLGGTYAQAVATSSDGSIVVGFSTDSIGNICAVRWINNTINNLGALPGGTSYSVANFCSADGSIIVGSANDSNGYAKPVKWTNGSISELTTQPGTVNGSANGCSPDGSIIVGYYLGAPDEIACVWVNGAKTELLGLGGTTSQANGCSSDGSVIVGIASEPFSITLYAVKWVKTGNVYGSPIKLSLLPGTDNSRAEECSTDGSIIVGYSAVGSTSNDAVSWININGSVTALGKLSGDISSQAAGCSANGNIIVGISIGLNNSVSFSTAVKWTNNEISSLGIPSGYASSQAQACSSDGSIIVGNALVNYSTSDAIIWRYT